MASQHIDVDSLLNYYFVTGYRSGLCVNVYESHYQACCAAEHDASESTGAFQCSM
jgi:hypothetical protein